MTRFLCAIHRRPDLSFEEFSRYWRTIHADIVLEFAHSAMQDGPLLGYVQNERLLPDIAGLESDFDGAPDLWVRDMDAFVAMTSAPRFQYAVEVDSPQFVVMPAIGFTVQESVLSGPAETSAVLDAVKLMLFFPMPEGEEGQRFAERWSNDNRPLLMPEASPLRLTRTLIDTHGGAADPSGFYGIECSWWPDADSLARAWASRTTPDTPGLAKLVARQRVMLSPPD